MKNTGDVIGAFLIGVAVGTVIGILYAPQSGEETRKFISEKGTKTIEDLNNKIHLLKEEIEKLKNEASKVTKQVLENISHKSDKSDQSEKEA
ncbi:MAG: YtxH domain-containing protein [bacterium]